MEEFLQKAQTLLQQMVDSRDAPTIVVARRLRDLAIVLDRLSLSAECVLVSHCALNLTSAIAPWSLELQLQYAETLALIAKLSPYQPHARTLFLRAISLCEKVVAKDGSHSNKKSLLGILDRAGYWSTEHPDLGVQWLGQAIRIMTTELPSVMVNDYTRSRIYLYHGNRLSGLGRLSEAVAVGQTAISLGRALSGRNPVKGKEILSSALFDLGNTLRELRQYEDSATAFKEALELDRSLLSQDPKSNNYTYNYTSTLVNYGDILFRTNQVAIAVELHQEAVARLSDLVQMDAKYSVHLCRALGSYGKDCYRLGRHSEAILAYEECISLARSLGEGGSTKSQIDLIHSLHRMANSLDILGRKSEAEAAASEFFQRNDGKPHKHCKVTTRNRKCFVCGRLGPSREAASPVVQNGFVLVPSPSQPTQPCALPVATSLEVSQSDRLMEHPETFHFLGEKGKAPKWFKRAFG